MCLPKLFQSSSPAPMPQLPPVQAPPPVVDTTKDNEQSKKARSDAEKAARAAKGRQSTISTTPLGLTTPPETKKPEVLGY